MRFDEFMADDLAMVAASTTWRASRSTSGPGRHGRLHGEHPRGKFGAVEYDLAQFGLDAEERRRALRFYTDRFER